MGVRSAAEARGLLASCFRRDWGVTAARAAARMLLSRVQYVGMRRSEVERLVQLRRRDRIDADPARVQHGAGVERLEAAAGAWVREAGVFGG